MVIIWPLRMGTAEVTRMRCSPSMEQNVLGTQSWAIRHDHLYTLRNERKIESIGLSFCLFFVFFFVF